jgi:hypothetical protein
MAGFCEHDDPTVGFIRLREFLDQLNNYRLFKIDPEAWSRLGVRMFYNSCRSLKAIVFVFSVLHRTGVSLVPCDSFIYGKSHYRCALHPFV